MTIKGIDNGYGYTKDESMHVFKSAYTKEEPMSLYSGHKLTVNSIPYWIGVGASTIDINKMDSVINKLCTLTCLGLSEDDVFKVVVGLPINQYRVNKDIFRDIVMGYDNNTISIDDNFTKTIHIVDVSVCPQSVATLYSSDIVDDVIIVDVGYRTVDIALVQIINNKPNVVLCDTYYCGMLSLYDKISSSINQKFELTTTANDMEHLLKRGLYINGKRQDISYLSEILRVYFEKMFSQLIVNYPTKTTPVLLTGGGASFVYKAFLNRFPQTVMHKNNQFSNAVGYYQIGKIIFS